jgi:esterase
MKLFYRKIGEEPTAMIVLHGLFGSSDNWLSLGKIFSQDFSVYLMDQRNHGQSPFSERHNYKDMADDLLEFMDAENIPNAVILGHSMGGKTAMRFALEYPERVSKLVVVDIGPKYYPVHHQTILDALLSVDLNQCTSRKDVDLLLNEKLTDNNMRQFLLKNIYWNEEKKMCWRMNLKVLNQDIENIGEAITENKSYFKPSLFLKGANSAYIHEDDFCGIHRLFSPSLIDCIPDAGHWVQADVPETFVASVNAFVKAPQYA